MRLVSPVVNLLRRPLFWCKWLGYLRLLLSALVVLYSASAVVCFFVVPPRSISDTGTKAVEQLNTISIFVVAIFVAYFVSREYGKRFTNLLDFEFTKHDDPAFRDLEKTIEEDVPVFKREMHQIRNFLWAGTWLLLGAIASSTIVSYLDAAHGFNWNASVQVPISDFIVAFLIYLLFLTIFQAALTSLTDQYRKEKNNVQKKMRRAIAKYELQLKKEKEISEFDDITTP